MNKLSHCPWNFLNANLKQTIKSRPNSLIFNKNSLMKILLSKISVVVCHGSCWSLPVALSLLLPPPPVVRWSPVSCASPSPSLPSPPEETPSLLSVHHVNQHKLYNMTTCKYFLELLLIWILPYYTLSQIYIHFKYLEIQEGRSELLHTNYAVKYQSYGDLF